ncbi:hypothetical protein EVAR_4489_1 [Eumeta japonica]|uniref:Uncharacterized protein n=1 Tax=Eumeta variegata TaxID=151549 RepID=A0A4C1T1D8_EUMVA|nr:hypothetical protein EVAR_4489_1 [Eumeta japonica]
MYATEQSETAGIPDAGVHCPRRWQREGDYSRMQGRTELEGSGWYKFLASPEGFDKGKVPDQSWEQDDRSKQKIKEHIPYPRRQAMSGKLV